MTDDPKPPTVITVAASSLQTGRRSDDPAIDAGPIAGHANVIIKVLQPLTIITVRALRVFLQTLLAALTAGMTGVLPAKDFLHLLLMCASISVGAAVICIIQNAIELLGKFDQTHPTLAG